jgi:transcriptional regulator with XRE-family HTH domain
MSSPLTAPAIDASHNQQMRKMAAAARRTDGEVEFSSLSGRLRYALAQRGTNPNRIELSTGIPRQTFYAVLKGQTQNFTYEVLARVSEFLGVRPEWLAKGEMPIHPAPDLKDDEEIQLIYDFRGMSPSHKRDLVEIARKWADDDDEAPSKGRPFHHPKPPRQ